jgi:hypothetical protein
VILIIAIVVIVIVIIVIIVIIAIAEIEAHIGRLIPSSHRPRTTCYAAMKMGSDMI